jgi:hypothetical protein
VFAQNSFYSRSWPSGTGPVQLYSYIRYGHTALRLYGPTRRAYSYGWSTEHGWHTWHGSSAAWLLLRSAAALEPAAREEVATSPPFRPSSCCPCGQESAARQSGPERRQVGVPLYRREERRLISRGKARQLASCTGPCLQRSSARRSRRRRTRQLRRRRPGGPWARSSFLVLTRMLPGVCHRRRR